MIDASDAAKMDAISTVSGKVAEAARSLARDAGLKPADLVQVMCIALTSTMLRHSKGADSLTALREVRGRYNAHVDAVMETLIDNPTADLLLMLARVAHRNPT